MINYFVCTITQKIFVLGFSYLDKMCIRMISRTYQILVLVTSISRLQGVIMYEKLLCVHDNSKIFMLGSSYWVLMCIRMISRTYQIVVMVTSVTRSQGHGVIMCEKLLCAQ